MGIEQLINYGAIGAVLVWLLTQVGPRLDKLMSVIQDSSAEQLDAIRAVQKSLLFLTLSQQGASAVADQARKELEELERVTGKTRQRG